MQRKEVEISMLKSAASATIAIVICHTSLAGGLSFKSSPLQAGRASLTEDGFRVSRSLGTANFTPELSLYANEAVYSWFAGNSEWKELNVDRTGWSSWVKKRWC